MKKRFKVDGLSRPVFAPIWWVAVAQFALLWLVACRPSVDESARSDLAAAHSLSHQNPGRALEEINHLRERLPEWHRPHVFAGRLYALEGNTNEAALALTRALELAPGDRQAALWYSRVAVSLGDTSTFDRARTALERQIATDPGDVRLYHALGTLLEAHGDVSGALGAYRLGVERLAEAARLHLDTARIYYRLGLTDRAETRATAALRLSQETGGAVREAAEELRARAGGGRR